MTDHDPSERGWPGFRKLLLTPDTVAVGILFLGMTALFLPLLKETYRVSPLRGVEILGVSLGFLFITAGGIFVVVTTRYYKWATKPRFGERRS